jgi:hypothetical protein
MITDAHAALVLVGGVLLVISVLLPRCARRWKRGGTSVRKP